MTSTDTVTDDNALPEPDQAAPRRGPLAVVVVGVVSALLASLVTFLLLRPGPAEVLPPVDEPQGQPTQEAPLPDPEDATGLLSWAPPELDDPERIELSEENRALELEDDQDYELVLPDEPLEAVGGVTVVGGRNIVLIGGEVSVPDSGDDTGSAVRGLFFQDQTGTVHVEGVAITGEGLREGINLDQREGAIVQVQNVRVDTVRGSEEGHHADVIQTWAGPKELRVDGLSGSTTYQGLFLLPQQFGDQDEPDGFDFRRIDIVGEEDSAYLFWRDDGDWPIEVSDVWVSPQFEDRSDFLWPRDDSAGSWTDIQIGTPPDGPFVPEGLAGVGYTSPGYGGDG